jgi:iron complex outermembrane recepter protein
VPSEPGGIDHPRRVARQSWTACFRRFPRALDNSADRLGQTRGSIPLFCLAVSIASVAFGQNADDVSPQVVPEVLVTGSHIARPASEQTGPVVLVTSADIERAGSDSIGKILQGLPAQTGATTNTNDNFGDGSTRINLRGLGDERTLVLLNGRRFIFGGLGADSSVDIDTIPVSMVDRIEVLGSGASAIYGSDAVAGVVNVITRKHYSGVEVGTDYRIAERADGAIRTAHLLGGHDDDRGNFVAGIEYVDQSAVSQASRAYSAHVESLVSPAGPVVQTGSFSNPQGVFIAPGNIQGWSDALLTRVTGSSGSATSDFRPFDPTTDFFNYAPYNYLQTPSERTAIWLSGRYKLTDSIEVFAEGLAQRRRSFQGYEPSDYSNFRAGGAVTWARNDATETNSGVLLRDALRLAVGPSGPDAAGNIVCGTPDPVTHIVAPVDVIAGCVPLNLFGGQGVDGRGTITPNQIAYISRTLRNRGNNQHWVVDGNLTGPLGRLPDGTIDWAIGAQFRRESGALALDPLTGRGVAGGFTLQLPSEAVFTSDEIYGEARVPFARDRIGANLLEVNLGTRYSHFSSFGAHTSAQVGVLWRPVHAITLRGQHSQVFRAPSTFESYAAPQLEVQAIADPCGSAPTSQQQIHCAANGVPGGAYEMAQTHGTQVVFGGYPQLRPEAGESWSAGISLAPDQPHLSVTADLWHVNLNRAVDLPSPQEIADDCADTGAATACSRITRLPDGSISEIDSRYANLTRLTVDGVDIGASASHSLWRGQFYRLLGRSFFLRVVYTHH